MRVCEGMEVTSAWDPEWAKRRNMELQTGPEGTPVPKGFEVVHVCTLPLTPGVATLVAKFPISLDAKGFTFDGRDYSGDGGGILLSDPTRPGEFFALGNDQGTAIWLAQRRAISVAMQGNYLAVSGGIHGLEKSGRFVSEGGRLAIDRASDKDAIAEREKFYGSLKKEKRGNVEWEFRESEKTAVIRWEKTAAGFAGKKGFRVRVYPDAAIKALYTGSSAPADIETADGAIRVDLDASAPEKPDRIAPALATAGLAAANPKLLARPTLAAAAGAQRFGTWWGREVKTFAAFVRAAGVEPSIEEVLATEPAQNLSPVLAVGAAASWLDAGARLDGEAAVLKSLSESDAALGARLTKWREAALRQTLRPPARRPLRDGFLRGVSYAMTNSIAEGYVSPRSRETLEKLAASGFDSISIMPFAFVSGPKESGISFVHRDPRGETDEGTVRAVADAHAARMTAMVKPQLWRAEGAFVGDLTMPGDAAWREWFSAYRRFVVHHAIVAEAAGADLFCVGAELSATELRKHDWNEVIAAVRLATGAPLTYAANWGVRAPEIPFWSSLDLIGVDFYDPLGKAEKLSDAQLTDGARRVIAPLAALARESGRPVLFTEAGYPPVRGAWIAPHDEESRRPRAPEDAARAIAALYRALRAETWWKGVYWWKAFSDGRAAAADERGFNIVGTASEKAILEGFRTLPAGAGTGGAP